MTEKLFSPLPSKIRISVGKRFCQVIDLHMSEGKEQVIIIQDIQIVSTWIQLLP